MFPSISFISMAIYGAKFDFIAQYDIKRLKHRCIPCIASIWTKHKASQGDGSGKLLICRGVVVEVSWLTANSDTQQQLPGTLGNTVLPLREQWSEFSSLMGKYLNMKQKLALLMLPITAVLRNTWCLASDLPLFILNAAIDIQIETANSVSCWIYVWVLFPNDTVNYYLRGYFTF